MVWQQGNRLSYEDFLEKYRIVVWFFAALFVVLSLRLFYLQIIKGDYFTGLSDQQHTNIVIERAPRGEIYGSKGEVIVKNKSSFVVLYYPFSESRIPGPEIADKLEEILNKEINAKIGGGHKIVKLIDKLSRNELFKVQEKRLSIPSIAVLEETSRDRVYPEAMSHMTGYLSDVSPDELENIEDEGYKSGDLIGRGGLEQQYDLDLRGQDGGWRIEVDALGHQTKMLQYIPSVKGSSLHTTIDTELQKTAYDALRRSSSGKGAVVIIDPRNGAVRALVSVPAFNPDFSKSSEFSKYLRNEDLPLFNRALQATYPPGSVFKIITFVSGVSENIVDPQDTYVCKGKFTLGNKDYACWLATGHGRISLVSAMANSCDVYFYNIGVKIGQKLLEKYSRMFRIGQKTGIDLPSEKKGLLPTPEWKKKKQKIKWFQGDTVNMSVGQGLLLVTPLQIASIMSAVANGGTIYKPYTVEKIVDPDGNAVFEHEPEINGKIELTDPAWKLIRKALEEVVKNGTAKACYFPNLKVAGKTGTAQNPLGEDHAWFASYAPSENPEIAVAIIVENGGSGGHEAVPVARAIYEQYFGLTTKREAKTTTEGRGTQR